MTERNALPILKTKLYRPPVATDTIVREKLIGKLETAGRLPLVLVSAPAGYGKSTLISDWVQRESHDCAWISLDKGDQDLRTFLTYVVEALSPFGSETVDRFDEILGAPERHPDQVLIRKFVNAVSSMPGEVKLVLDDYHLCASPAIDACIEALLKHAMSGIQVVIVTRKSPDFDISSLVLSNRVCTIYARDLLFDSCEIRAFGENIVTDFDKEGVSEIKEITEGWAAGLRMVFLEMRGTRSDGNHKTGSAVGTRTVENLFTNLMKTVPQSSSPLWHAASLLDKFSVDLLGAVCDDLDKGVIQRFVRELEISNMFIVPLDNDHGWFRFHHLFKELLFDQADKNSNEESRLAVYDKAAQFYFQDGRLKESINYLIKAKRLDKATEVFCSIRQQLMNGSRWFELETLFELFQYETVMEYPDLFHTRLWLMVYSGQIMQMFDGVSNYNFNEDELTPSQSAELQSLRAYYTYSIARDYHKCIEECTFALKHLPSDAAVQRGYAHIFLYGAMQASGENERALTLALAAIHTSHHTVEHASIRLVLCYIYYITNDLLSLTLAAQELISLGHSTDNKEMLANGFHFAAVSEYSKGNFDAAVRNAKDSWRHRYHAVGVIHIMNGICYAYSLLFSNLQKESMEILHGLREYVYQASNAMYLTILDGAELFVANKGRPTHGLLSWTENVDKLPAVSLTNFFNYPIAEIQMLENLGDIKSSERAEERLERWQGFAESSNNSRARIELKLLRAIHCVKKGGKNMRSEEFSAVIEELLTTGLVAPLIEIYPAIQKTSALSLLPDHQQQSVQAILDRCSAVFMPSLTQREKQVLKLILEGCTNKEIGQNLHIAEKTVKRHANGLYKKLKVSGRLEIRSLPRESLLTEEM